MNLKARDFLLKENELYEFYLTELSDKKIFLLNWKSRLAMISALAFAVASMVLPIISLFDGTNKFSVSAVMILMTFAVLSMKTYNYLSLVQARNNFTDYKRLIKKPYHRFSNRKYFLRAYRSDQTYNKLQSMGMDSPQMIDELIQYYKGQGEEIKTKRWWPVTIISLFLFSVWNEFIGGMIGKSNDKGEMFTTAFQLFGVSIFFIFIIISVKNLLESFLLGSAGKLNELSKILSLIKMSNL